MDAAWENRGPLLVAWGQPDAEGRMSSVVVWRSRLEGGLLTETGGGMLPWTP